MQLLRGGAHQRRDVFQRRGVSQPRSVLRRRLSGQAVDELVLFGACGPGQVSRMSNFGDRLGDDKANETRFQIAMKFFVAQ